MRAAPRGGWGLLSKGESYANGSSGGEAAWVFQGRGPLPQCPASVRHQRISVLHDMVPEAQEASFPHLAA